MRCSRMAGTGRSRQDSGTLWGADILGFEQSGVAVDHYLNVSEPHLLICKRER